MSCMPRRPPFRKQDLRKREARPLGEYHGREKHRALSCIPRQRRISRRPTDPSRLREAFTRKIKELRTSFPTPDQGLKCPLPPNPLRLDSLNPEDPQHISEISNARTQVKALKLIRNI